MEWNESNVGRIARILVLLVYMLSLHVTYVLCLHYIDFSVYYYWK